MTSSTNGEGVTFTYTYNAGARLTSINGGTLWGNPVHYNGAGAVTSATFGNGIIETRSYDTRLRLTGISDVNPTTDASIYSLTIPNGDYAPNSDILAANDSVNGDWTYSYDPFNRVISSNQNSGATTYSYSYDRFGNRSNQTVTAGSGLSTSFGFGANNRIVSGVGATYDAAGDTTDDGTTAYTYDAEGRVTSAVNATSGTSTYIYNTDGRRTQKTTAAGGAVNYLYDLSGHPITEINSAGWLRGEIYAGNRHIATYADDNTYYIHSDWLGTERVRSALNGTLVAETCTSLPFGDGLTCVGGDVSPMHFTGKEHDTETGLENFIARYDSSAMGRFMSPDPEDAGATHDAPQTWNAYSYTANNPLDATDPDGLDCVFVQNNTVWVASGDCTGINNGTYVAGTVDPKSGTYDPNTGTVGFSYAPYGGGLGSSTVAGVYPSSGVSDSDWFNAGLLGTQMAGYVLDTPERWRNALFAWEGRHPNITATVAIVGGLIAGDGEPEEEPEVSTGRNVPVNLKEHLAMQQAKSNPYAGKQLPVPMTDPSWPADQGWVKMAQNVNGIEIHYNLNTETGETGDWKFK
jgi:RHS repeat-associated protein